MLLFYRGYSLIDSGVTVRLLRHYDLFSLPLIDSPGYRFFCNNYDDNTNRNNNNNNNNILIIIKYLYLLQE